MEKKAFMPGIRFYLSATCEPTSYFPSTGVRQGCALAPLLFSIVIDSLAWRIQSCVDTQPNLGVTIPGLIRHTHSRVSIMLYADDLVLFGHSPEALQKLVDVTETWCREWGFSLSSTKSKVMHIVPTNGRRIIPPIQCSAGTIEAVTTFKYLGVIFSQDLSINNEIASRMELFHKSHVNLDRLYVNNTWTVKSRTQTYLSLTESIGLYASSTWLTTYDSLTPLLSKVASHLRVLLSLPKIPNLSTACSELHIVHPWLLAKRIQLDWLKSQLETPNLITALLRTPVRRAPIYQILLSCKSIGYMTLQSFNEFWPLFHSIDTIIQRERRTTKRVDNYFLYYNHVRWTNANQLLLNLRHPQLHFGRSILHQFRTGTWRNASDDTRIYCGKHRLPLPANIALCKFCGHIKEDLPHILLDCPIWTPVRESHLPNMLSQFICFPDWHTLNPTQQTAVLLGGLPPDISLLVWSEKHLLTAVTSFLQAIVETRNAVKNLLGYE